MSEALKRAAELASEERLAASMAEYIEVTGDTDGPCDWDLEFWHAGYKHGALAVIDALAAHDAAKRAEWEAEQGEPEWEYSRGYKQEDFVGQLSDYASSWRPGAEAEVAERRGDGYSILIRRRKAGPWLPVPDPVRVSDSPVHDSDTNESEG